MVSSLDDKIAVVTGASSGIGKHASKKLAEKGANIVLASRSKGKLDKIAEEIENEFNVSTLVVETDVTELEDVKNLYSEAIADFGKVDIVVNNAGIVLTGDIKEMEYYDYHRNMDVNVDGMFYVAKESLEFLEETNGKIIFLGSIAGQYPRGNNPVYAGTKWWVRGFALSLEAQIGDKGISVTIVNPSEVRTRFNEEKGKAFEEAFEKGEVTEPEDVAEAIVFAAEQEGPNTVSEIDLYRKDKLSDFSFR